MIVNRACDEATNYKRFYGEPIPGHVLCERVASYVHMFNLYWSLRPYGATTLLATYDKNGPALHVVEPSGQSCVSRIHAWVLDPSGPLRGRWH